MAKRGVMLDVEWDRSQWDKSYRETKQILGNMQPIMEAAGKHMVASIRQTLTEGGPPGKPWKPVLRGGKPLLDTGQHIFSRVHLAGADADEARIGSGFEFAHIHQFGATITAKRHPYLLFQIGGQWVRKAEVEIPARPYMVFRPDDPKKIAGIARDAVESAFGGGAGAFWGLV